MHLPVKCCEVCCPVALWDTGSTEFIFLVLFGLDCVCHTRRHPSDLNDLASHFDAAICLNVDQRPQGLNRPIINFSQCCRSLVKVSIRDNFSFLDSFFILASSRAAQLRPAPCHTAARTTGRRDLVYLAPRALVLCSWRRRSTQVVMPV